MMQTCRELQLMAAGCYGEARHNYAWNKGTINWSRYDSLDYQVRAAVLSQADRLLRGVE